MTARMRCILRVSRRKMAEKRDFFSPSGIGGVGARRPLPHTCKEGIVHRLQPATHWRYGCSLSRLLVAACVCVRLCWYVNTSFHNPARTKRRRKRVTNSLEEEKEAYLPLVLLCGLTLEGFLQEGLRIPCFMYPTRVQVHLRFSTWSVLFVCCCIFKRLVPTTPFLSKHLCVLELRSNIPYLTISFASVLALHSDKIS